jgi:hypothetical protein
MMVVHLRNMIEVMMKILIDPHTEHQISHHMISVSKHYSSLLASDNLLKKRSI